MTIGLITFAAMNKSDIITLPEFFDRYINLVKEDSLLEALEQSYDALLAADIAMLNRIGLKTYAPRKWTVNEIYQHILDNERIQAYRALRFARKDNTPLPGYDEDFIAANSWANDRSIEEIIEELKIVRQSSILLYKSFSKDAVLNEGTASNIKITPLALGFVIVGHEIHHLQVLRERYYPLA